MCGIAGFISHKYSKENGNRLKKGMILQNDRGNGLGAGYGAYGIFPVYKDFYAFHVMGQTSFVVDEVTQYLKEHFWVAHKEEISIWDKVIQDHPLFMRYFLQPKLSGDDINPDDFVIDKVMHINTAIDGAFVFSSGKNMGVFKGVGTPKDIYEFFRLDEYQGYCWIGHNRFPTNTPGWWGGAHPFNLLNWSIVHNGEISSYGINRRYLESNHYLCTLQTDTEVAAYLLDLLIRRHGLSIDDAITVLAPPYWSSANRFTDPQARDRIIALKVIYESAMLNGPFAILAGFDRGLFSITDNTKLRPMVVGKADGYTYFASEVSALYEMEENLAEVTTPRAGQPAIVYYQTEG
ncbi:MAG TPA: glutamine amidotransferase family protein [Thermodesulfobacteriota bacterium]|nr:glutamine amidotransferase family protein [Thermodesulfobacteriota bacterium]